MAETQKPVIGFSCGDLNGIGPELIIKVLGDSRMLDICTPVVFASNKVINFYKKAFPEINFNYQAVKDYRFNPKMINVYTCWEEDVNITPGSLNETGGKYAVKSLTAAVQALKEKVIDGLVTAPIHKKNVQSSEFNYTGHTPYLKAAFEAKDVLMILTAENLKVALLSEHVPVTDIAKAVTKENLLSKLDILNQSLKKDFGISKPRIAVLGLNPHAGDEGLVGTEEDTIIKPAIKEAKQKDMMVFGPYSADAFFARGQHEKFDAILAMYHDQGLIPFKSLAIGEGVNFTAGIPGVRTSPDHGTAFDIAGKNKADESSMREAVFTAIDILRNQFEYTDSRKNPLRKMSHIVLRGAEDEKIEQQPEGA
ncbi:MAG: 4-hydroxythreonine-4-phosphate dehydrogenase PdxA [Sphingobacteriales bacterium]|nr:MAG: 4-hydroxythreonine-4-phosphate dehydrogenase PdxA [Sphingobacteriales bacterium]